MSLSFPGRVLAAGLVAVAFAGPAAADDPKPKFEPKDVRVGPPPELASLRAAVEDAAKKGENVDEIRKQLEALEKALAGKAWAKPKVADEPAPRPANRPQPPADPLGFQGGPQVLPGGLGGLMLPQGGNNPFGGLGGLGLGAGPGDLNDLLKAQELLLKAAQLAAEDPNNAEKAQALQKEAQDMLTKALGGRGGLAVLPGLEGFGGLGAFGGLDGFGGFDPPPAGKPRLGVKVEPAEVDLGREAGVPAGRGVRVVEVVPGLPAAKAGLREGDVIVEFGGRAVGANSVNFVRMVQRARAGEKVDIVYVRDGKRETAKGVALENPAD